MQSNGQSPQRVAPLAAVTVPLPTPFGEFAVHAFECSDGFVYLALVRGDLGDGTRVLTRLHSECLTGDVLGSLRCDCGVQLRLALRTIAAEGRGVLLYLTGHEGRGVGLVNKLRAYVEQDTGADTVEANLRLGMPVDARSYAEAAQVLHSLGVRSVRLLSNNPRKAQGLALAGVGVEGVERLATAAHVRNQRYLRTKQHRLGHVQPSGDTLVPLADVAADVSALLGIVAPPPDRPYVVLKYAQTLDGRIATSSGDSKWISGPAERTVSHALRAACDAVLVGVGTVLRDDPQLTVRMVPGASPLRVVLDSRLRTPLRARVLSDDAATVVLTTDHAPAARRRALRERGVSVRAVPRGAHGVHLPASLRLLRAAGVSSLLVEGGARVITALLASGLVDRLVVAVAPRIIGSGTEAVGALGTERVEQGVQLTNRTVHVVDDDILLAWDVNASSADARDARSE